MSAMQKEMTSVRSEKPAAATSVERAFWVIDLIADSPRGLPQAEVVRKLHISQIVADKLLATLLKIGFVRRNDHTKTLYLTHRVSNLGMKQLERAQPLNFVPPK
jgi:DNA-binding IclR family transcriptional regulator